jgi:hypothetical protein
LNLEAARGKERFSRGVAQPGRALALGAKGREFESRRPDQKIKARADNPVRAFVVSVCELTQPRRLSLSQVHDLHLGANRVIPLIAL